MNRILTCLLLCLWASLTTAAHITDKLVVGLYGKADLSGKPDRLLTSGTPVEVLEEQEDKARVRLGDGTIGWIEARYVSEAKPAAMALLEARAEIRRLKHQLQSVRGAPDTAPPPPLPSAEKARLGLELGKARQRIAELEQSLAELPRLQAAARERDELAERLHAVREALGLETVPGTPTAASHAPLAEGTDWRLDWRLWLGAGGLLLFGFLSGTFFIKRRISRRFRGLRI